MSLKHPLTKLIALDECLPADTLNYEEKLQRDRKISVDAKANTPGKQIDAWLASQSSGACQNKAERWLFSWHVVQLILLFIGLVFGAGLASLVLQYDGTQPINIISAWIVLAGLPFLLMCLWLLTLLPFRFPAISLLSEVVQRSIFQPLSAWILRHLNKSQNHGAADKRVFMPGQKLLLSMSNVLMQWFAFGMGLGVLLTSLYLLASSDLAFAWSTSFGIQAASLHTITNTISAPFVSFIEAAAPSLDLIKSSHYFRLEEAASQQFTADKAADQLTQWWPFLVASVATYAVLPRILTLLIARNQFKKTVLTDIKALPEYASLIARMNAPLVTTTHINSPKNSDILETAPPPKPMHFSLSAPLINWGQIKIEPALLEQALSNVGLQVESRFEAGGRNSTQEDTKIIAQLQQLKADDALILVKAWEPPLLEFKDWLGQLRKTIKGSIIILLLDPDNSHPSAADISLWRADLQQLADSGLYIEGLSL